MEILLGKRIREQRKEKHLTQKALSEMLKVERSVVSIWEGGRARPNYEHLIMLAKIFKVTIDYLLGVET